MATEDVYCTLLMSDGYLPGAAVLAHSLRDSGTKKKIAALVTLDSLLYNTITLLKSIFDYVLPVEKIANPNVENLIRLGRLDLRFAFTKIALWRQEQFRKIVYIDADAVALRAPDELFDLGHKFAAAPDIGWPDCFNSGVMMLTPNMGDYWSLQTLASSGASFDGADQGLFNEYFANRPWHRLSFTYNCTPSSSYQYEPAYRHFRSNISMTHFIGKQKPWQTGRNAMSRSASGVYRELVGRWWSVYDRHYKAKKPVALGKVSSADRHLQHFVNDEDSDSVKGLGAAADDSSGNEKSILHPDIQVTSTEVPFTEPSDALESLETQPPLTSEQRHFEPPRMAWDATRSAPPAESKAEAGAFPSQRYEMSQSTGLFHAPPSYPEPPKDMYYQVPPRPEPADKPTPIFPWEKQAKKPTRVFAENITVFPTEPVPHSASKAPVEAPTTSTAASTNISGVSLVTHGAPTGALDSFSRTNAWDNVTSIDHYVRAVREAQAKRGKVQVLHTQELANEISDAEVSASTSPTKKPGKRRESLIITDFPTEVERPSLPVTPAPIRRPTFWGEERDEQGELPAAEGVPNQSDWDPHERLEQLRKSSVAAAEELPQQSLSKETPLRAVPETSAHLTHTSPTLGASDAKQSVPSGGKPVGTGRV